MAQLAGPMRPLVQTTPHLLTRRPTCLAPGTQPLLPRAPGWLHPGLLPIIPPPPPPPAPGHPQARLPGIRRLALGKGAGEDDEGVATPQDVRALLEGPWLQVRVGGGLEGGGRAAGHHRATTGRNHATPTSTPRTQTV
jgi:hypothetical protein